MPVTEFECAIAKSQIGRYISGDTLAGEVVRQLESHIGACPKCKALLEAKRAELVAILENPASQSEDKSAVPVAMVAPKPLTPKPVAVKESPAPAVYETKEAQIPTQEVANQDLKAMLRERLASMNTKAPQPEVIELPVVAPAFAHKDERKPETVRMVMNPSSPKVDKPSKKISLSSFALFRRVPDTEETTDAPATSALGLTKENIKEAKVAFKANNPTVRKPMMYAAGLAVVIAAMSFVIKDPTSFLGPKANNDLLVDRDKLQQTDKKSSNKRTNKVVKNASDNSAARLSTKSGTNAQKFAMTDESAVKTQIKAKTKATAKLKRTQTAVAALDAKITKKKNSSKAVQKDLKPREFVAKEPAKAPTRLKSKKASRPSVEPKIQRVVTSQPTKKKSTKKVVPSNTVRVYGPDGNPIN